MKNPDFAISIYGEKYISKIDIPLIFLGIKKIKSVDSIHWKIIDERLTLVEINDDDPLHILDRNFTESDPTFAEWFNGKIEVFSEEFRPIYSIDKKKQIVKENFY
jgi:hypothetical protein